MMPRWNAIITHEEDIVIGSYLQKCIKLMYLNIGQGNALGLGNIGDFYNTPIGVRWGAELISNLEHAWFQNFSNGLQNNGSVVECGVRAIRAF